MTMYKLTKKTISSINEWLLAMGFDCVAERQPEWEYIPDEEIIGIPKFYDCDCDCEFMRTLRKMGLKENFDTITLSLLHELGHHMTLDTLSEKEYDECNFTIDGLAMAGLAEDDFLAKYWQVPSERLANEWLVNFCNHNKYYVWSLEDGIFANIKWESKFSHCW